MSLRERISSNEAVRAIILPLMRRAGFDITVSHPWVDGARLTLHSYRHKGYWFYGKSRENASMLLFSNIISIGDAVAEVGGHIGFITGYFAKLAGKSGTVTVFEPGSNNLPYIRRNVARLATMNQLAPIMLVESAVGPEPATVAFYEDDITGQNNSIVKDFDVLASNARSAHVDVTINRREVDMVSIDTVFADRALDFVKIDVEGFELGVLQGMTNTLAKQRPAIMVEVQASQADIFELLSQAGYRLFSEQRVEARSPLALRGNMFALHAATHAPLIAEHFT